MLDLDYVKESYIFLQLIDELLEDFSRYYLRHKKIIRPDLSPYRKISVDQLLLYMSVLFSNNFDSIEPYLPNELKQDVVHSIKLDRPVGHFSFENGSPYNYGNGLTIYKIPAKHRNDATFLIRQIRNYIAHSDYTIQNGKIRMRGEVDLDCDIFWLFSAVNILFFSANSCRKKGYSDTLKGFIRLDDHPKNIEQLKNALANGNGCRIRLTLNCDAEENQVSMGNVIAFFQEFVRHYSSENYFRLHSQIQPDREKLLIGYREFLCQKCQELYPYFTYQLEPLASDLVQELNLRERDYFFQQLSFSDQINVLSNLDSILEHSAKRNTIAFKFLSEILIQLEDCQDKVELADRMLKLHPTFPLYLGICQQFNEKSRINLLFNYVREKDYERFSQCLPLSKLITKSQFFQYKQQVGIRLSEVSKRIYDGGEQVRNKWEPIEELLIRELDCSEPSPTQARYLVPRNIRNSVVHGMIFYPKMTDTDHIIFQVFDHRAKWYELSISTLELNQIMDQTFSRLFQEQNRVNSVLADREKSKIKTRTYPK